MVYFGLLTAEIRWRVWGIPANFNGFRILAALLHGTLVVGVSQTFFVTLNRGRHLYSAGRPSRWALAHISSLCLFYVVVHFFWMMNAFIVLGLVFPYKAKRLAWETSPKWPVLCWVGHNTLNQSTNQLRISVTLWSRYCSRPAVYACSVCVRMRNDVWYRYLACWFVFAISWSLCWSRS